MVDRLQTTLSLTDRRIDKSSGQGNARITKNSDEGTQSSGHGSTSHGQSFQLDQEKSEREEESG